MELSKEEHCGCQRKCTCSYLDTEPAVERPAPVTLIFCNESRGDGRLRYSEYDDMDELRRRLVGSFWDLSRYSFLIKGIHYEWDSMWKRSNPDGHIRGVEMADHIAHCLDLHRGFYEAEARTTAGRNRIRP